MRPPYSCISFCVLCCVFVHEASIMIDAYGYSTTPFHRVVFRRHQTGASNYYNNHLTGVHSKSALSASVGGAPNPTAPPPNRGMLIVPSTSEGESELMILENFSQIQSGEKKKFGVIGTSDLSNNHRQMVELLAYALVLSGNHVFTSAGGNNGTNIAVIKGALRACNPDLLTVILPQSLFQQPPEIHPLLLRVANLVQQPEFDDVDIREAAYMCNEVLISNVDKMLVFCYHDSTTILDAIDNVAGDIESIKFFLD